MLGVIYKFVIRLPYNSVLDLQHVIVPSSVSFLETHQQNSTLPGNELDPHVIYIHLKKGQSRVEKMSTTKRAKIN